MNTSGSLQDLLQASHLKHHRHQLAPEASRLFLLSTHTTRPVYHVVCIHRSGSALNLGAMHPSAKAHVAQTLGKHWDSRPGS